MPVPRFRSFATVATVAGLSAAAVTVAPSMAASDSSSSKAKTTTTQTDPQKRDGSCDGRRGGGRGPAALRLSEAALRADPPTDAKRPNGRRGDGPPRGGNGGPGGPGGPNGQAPSAEDRLKQRTTHYAAIAKSLNKETADVTAAVRGALVKDLDRRVTAKTITQARADAVLKAWDAGTRPAAGAQDKAEKPDTAAKGKRPTRAEMSEEIATFRKDVADALGVTVKELVTALDAAKPAKPADPSGKTDNG